jgi:(p)ppGpp synthase/HD superfamily hydrolase
MARASKQLPEAIEKLNNTDGIEVCTNAAEYRGFTTRWLVKVQTESAIGKFYEYTRKYAKDTSAVTRNGLSETALDAWVDTE